MREGMDSDEGQKALYMLLGEMRGDLKSILGSLVTQREDHLRLKAEVAKLEGIQNERIFKLERAYWKVMGVATLSPVGLTLVGWYLRSQL